MSTISTLARQNTAMYEREEIIKLIEGYKESETASDSGGYLGQLSRDETRKTCNDLIALIKTRG